jgi:SAM-dependent methyltransferase
MREETWSYDLIADVYDTDMGRSMPFDDVGFYRRLCVAADGRILELGCGTGRILLDLIASGVDAIGVDRSLPMLTRVREDAASRGIPAPRIAQMDIGELALTGKFAVILAPYSLITYLTDSDDARRVLQQLHPLLDERGIVVLDAFIPQRVDAFSDFRQDYRRQHMNGTLERAKRIESLGDGVNRIERRYRLFDSREVLVSEFVTVESIRPYPPELIARVATDAGFDIDGWSYDYGTRSDSTAARFATAILKPSRGK